MYELIFWGILFIATVVIESMTVQLISIWFSVGSAAAFIAAVFHAPLSVQLLLFLVLSVLLLICTRPLVRKISTKPQPTNADALIGKAGIVTETIDNLQNRGRAKIDGLSWNARSTDSSLIEEGAAVKVVRLEGVTAYVERLMEANPPSKS